MELLYDETYASNDGGRASRNIWYGDAGITAEGEYGVIIRLGDDVRDSLCEAIKKDLSKNAVNPNTETNWYFYGSGVAAESIGGNILPAIMVRERDGKFISNFSISDHDFAVNIDAILSLKEDFEKCLMR